MTREFPDELLSGYLDGELSADEQVLVEQRLATSEADRQLLDELRSLRGDLATLPGVNVDSGFADRVVQAALAQAAAAQASDGRPSLEVAARSARRTRKWMYAAAVLAAAASLLVAIQPWRSSSTNVPTVVMSPQDAMISTLRIHAPTEGQALVVRMQVPKGAAGSLDAALAEAGIESLAAGGTRTLGDAYRRQVADKLTANSTAASDALLVEAPLADIERALVALAGEGKNRVNLSAETKLDWNKIVRDQEAAGEPGSGSTIVPGRSIAQRLDAGQFPLSSGAIPAVAPMAAIPAPATAGPVRLIILVEQLGAGR